MSFCFMHYSVNTVVSLVFSGYGIIGVKQIEVGFISCDST